MEAVVNMALRVGALAFRFALILYVTSYIGLEALANYGFLVSAIAIFIALSAIGLSPDVERQFGQAQHAVATLLLRDRLLARLAVSVVAYAAVLAVDRSRLVDLGPLASPLAFAIVVGEAVLFDVQRALIFRFHAVFANLLYAYRSAAWIPFVIAFGLIDPASRTIETVFAGWAAAIVACLVALLPLLRHSDMSRCLLTPVRTPYLRYLKGKSLAFYATNVGFTLAFYVDRFIVAWLCGMRDTGAFVFVWSFVNAAMSVAQIGLVQTALPHFQQAWINKSAIYWRRLVTRQVWAVAALAFATGAGCLLALLIVLPLAGHGLALGHATLTVTLTLAFAIRLVADALHQAIYGAALDRAWLSINATVVLASPPLGALLVATLGLDGAGVMALLSALALAGLRYFVFVRAAPADA